jgi:hypothetical protein
MVAAYLLGTGEADGAFQTLAALNEEWPSPFNAVMAARCLMRPEGQERELVAYLTEQAERFPDDLYVVLNLATGHFCLGNVGEANRLLDTVRAQWKDSIADSLPATTDLVEELERALAQKVVYRKFRYDEMSYQEHLIKDHWEPYFCWMTLQSPYLMFGWLKNIYRDSLINLLRSDPSINEVYNFGIMCGAADFEVASAFPTVKFVGVDRQRETARLNGIAYSRPNIEFVASEIEDHLSVLPVEKGVNRVLFHARTATLCYPEKMRALYKLAASKGFTYVVLFENCSISHNDHVFHSPDRFPNEAMVYKNDQFIHNYKEYLSDAGYDVASRTILFSPLVSPFSNIDLGSTHVLLTARRHSAG